MHPWWTRIASEAGAARHAIAAASCLVVASCGAPQPMTAQIAPVTTMPDPVSDLGSVAATPAASTRPQASVPRIDANCRADTDCAVKDVGNCCGAHPACVNVDSPTDPAAVQAACRASGKMAACGFRQIASCRCDAGTCRAASEPVGGWTDGPQPVPVQ